MSARNSADAVLEIFRASTLDANANANAKHVPDRTALPAIANDQVATSAVADTEPVLAVEDIATLLRVGRNTVYALVAKNQIPHRRLGKQIRFSRAAVMSWLSASWQVAKEGK